MPIFIVRGPPSVSVAGWRRAAHCGVVAGARNTRLLRLVECEIPKLAAWQAYHEFDAGSNPLPPSNYVTVRPNHTLTASGTGPGVIAEFIVRHQCDLHMAFVPPRRGRC